jgi:uncharacterized surface protein with fasciclin (FAS1) repeats
LAVSWVVSSNCDYFLRSDFVLLNPIEITPNEIWHRACSTLGSGRFTKKIKKEESKMRIFKAALGAMVISVGLGLGGAAKAEMAPEKDIVDTAVSAGSFKTLVAAVQAAGLVDTLKGKGPLTVFAPTDEAFAKLPAGTVESLLKPENLGKLQAILTYHVVPGQVTASEVVTLKSAKTANGRALQINVADGKVMVDNAQVVSTDIMASNGVIHVIDTVVIP